MAGKIRKNDAYSKLLLEEGSETAVDEDFTMELPVWADEKKIKVAQRFFLLNLNAMARAFNICFFASLSTESIVKILIFTKQSSTAALAYRRFRANALHAQLWYKYPIKQGTIAWKSLETVRRMHVVVNKRTRKSGIGIISQKDMALTQFTFMGFNLLCPEKFGIVGSREQFEAFNHLQRLIAYLLGTDDKYNCCGETLDDTLSRLEAIREDIFLPALSSVSREVESYMRTTAEDTILFQTKRFTKVSGYHLFESEAPFVNDNGTRKAFDDLSLCTRFRILSEVIVYEYLSFVLVFRWIFNIVRIFMSLLEKYPILALNRFGKKFAYVEIMKSKNI